MTGIDGILFDKDGTLFDYHATWAGWAKSFLTELAGDDPARARQLSSHVGFDYDGTRFEADSLLIASTPHEISASLIPYLPGATKSAMIARMNALAAEAPQVEATPLVPLLCELRSRGLRLGVATNDVAMVAAAHLQQVGVLEFFDKVLGCDSGFAPKPSPDMLTAFCEFADLEPGRVAMVGDSPHDMAAARSAGMIAVAVLTGPSGYNKVAALADVVLQSIAQLPAWLDSLSPRRRVSAA